MKLFWKELKQAEVPDRGLKCKFGRGTVWASLDKVVVDSAKLEHLFESKAKELPVAKVTDFDWLFTRLLLVDVSSYVGCSSLVIVGLISLVNVSSCYWWLFLSS